MRLVSLLAMGLTLANTAIQAKVVYCTPLSEAGQSGICLHGDKLFLAVHAKLEGSLKGNWA
ncbi:MAG: hypothetical protein ABGZ53_06110 [Fuerstiella sp.]